MLWLCLLCLATAERDVPATGRALIQHGGLKKSQTVELQESYEPPMPLGVEGVGDMMPLDVKPGVPTPRMMVLAMLLLMSLLCILIDVIGRFIFHLAGIVCDDCEAGNETRGWEEEKELTALAFVRLLGAVHLVMCSYGPSWCEGFNAWGASWFSFYFILTGLGSAYVKLRKRQSYSWAPRGQAMLRHLALVYPLYLLALSWKLVNQRLLGPQEPLDPFSLLMELAMLQAFLPNRLLHHYNPPSSFFSALALCWVLEEALCKLGSHCWDSGRWARRSASLAVLLWVVLWPYGAPGKLVNPEDDIMALSYVHCYFCGVLLAHCLHERQAAAASPISASGSVLILATVFCGFSDQKTASTWAAFLLLPVQCLLVYGLGRGEDPLARSFSTWPLPRLSELALGIYIFQAPSKQVLDALLGWQGSYSLSQMGVLLLILALLAALAQLLQRFVARFL